MNAVLWSVASVVLVSGVSLVGVLTLALDERRVRRLSTGFIGFAVGALLGDSFIHLLPDVFTRADAAHSPLARSLLVLAGMLLFFVVEKLLRHSHGPLHTQFHGAAVARPELAAINVLGDAVHNFIDGALIAASYLASPELGIGTTLAVILHEIPQEIADFGILVHSGLSVRKAVLLNLASASVALLGMVGVLAAGTMVHDRVSALLVPVTAGGFVYLASADLIPELQHDRSLRAVLSQSALIASGVGVMALLTLLE
ncbi:MAG: ZIP family metal transporter [Myxococcaceae bacterium]|nr:MAG: ZIP family metal transporter [Myxococcaceae bacterium]